MLTNLRMQRSRQQRLRLPRISGVVSRVFAIVKMSAEISDAKRHGSGDHPWVARGCREGEGIHADAADKRPKDRRTRILARVRGLFLTCQHCGHGRAVNMDDWPDDATARPLAHAGAEAAAPSLVRPRYRTGSKRADRLPGGTLRSGRSHRRGRLGSIPGG
jgi:hypothetical protein